MTTSFKEQPITDIQRQLKESPVAAQDNLHAAKYVFAERVQAINALFTFATSSIEEKCQRRTAAIHTLIALCKKQESQGSRRRKTNIKIKKKQTSPFASPPPNPSENPSRRMQSHSNTSSASATKELSAADRLKTFASRGDLKKHFHRKHLRRHPDHQPITCPHPKCDGYLDRNSALAKSCRRM